MAKMTITMLTGATYDTTSKTATFIAEQEAPEPPEDLAAAIERFDAIERAALWKITLPVTGMAQTSNATITYHDDDGNELVRTYVNGVWK